jgi:signal transduction histidine kinase
MVVAGNNMGFRQQLFVGYSASFLITVATGSFAVIALRLTAANEARLAHQYADELLQVERMRFQAEHIVATTRAYLLLREPVYLERVNAAAAELDARLGELHAATLSRASTDDLTAVAKAARDYAESARGLANEDPPAVVRSIEQFLQPPRAALQQSLESLAHRERALFEDALAASCNKASRAGMLVGLTTGIGLALSALLAVAVMRRLARQHAAAGKVADDARRAAAARQEMLAIVSHDLRGPLGTILMGSDLLDMTLGEPNKLADTRRHAAVIRLAADRMKHLVDQILDAAQIDAGTLRLSFERCDVGSLLQASIDLFSGGAAQAKVSLRAEPPVPPIVVRADKERVLQILANLIGNGLKFTPAGGAIVLRARTVGDVVHFQVEDTGAGIPDDQLAHLFDRFWQAEPSTPRRSSGVGLGLYICKNLVAAHRGRIWVDSGPGRGSCFHFTLPQGADIAIGTVSLPREPLLLVEDKRP